MCWVIYLGILVHLEIKIIIMWYNSDKDLEEGDLIYFQKRENQLDHTWTIGRVEQVVRSNRDQMIRRVVVKYQNAGENRPRFTDRAVRQLVHSQS